MKWTRAVMKWAPMDWQLSDGRSIRVSVTEQKRILRALEISFKRRRHHGLWAMLQMRRHFARPNAKRRKLHRISIVRKLS